MLYLDTSALVKLYLIEPDGDGIASAVHVNQQWLFTTIVTYAETLSTLARALREKRITRANYNRQMRAFQSDWDALHVIDLTPVVLGRARGLVERHGLRGFDAIHLCSALWIGSPDFACFDVRLRDAAAAEGLTLLPGKVKIS